MYVPDHPHLFLANFSLLSLCKNILESIPTCWAMCTSRWPDFKSCSGFKLAKLHATKLRTVCYVSTHECTCSQNYGELLLCASWTSPKNPVCPLLQNLCFELLSCRGARCAPTIARYLGWRWGAVWWGKISIQPLEKNKTTCYFWQRAAEMHWVNLVGWFK